MLLVLPCRHRFESTLFQYSYDSCTPSISSLPLPPHICIAMHDKGHVTDIM